MKWTVMALASLLLLSGQAMGQTSGQKARSALALSLAASPATPPAKSGCPCPQGLRCICPLSGCNCNEICKCGPDSACNQPNVPNPPSATCHGSFMSGDYLIEWWTDKPVGIECQWDANQKNWWRATWAGQSQTRGLRSASDSPYSSSSGLAGPATGYFVSSGGACVGGR